MSRKNIGEVVIGVLAIASIVLVAVESLVSVSHGTLMGILITDLVICIVFAGDFIERLRASELRSRFMKTNGFEMLAMIPALALYGLGVIPALAVALRSLRLVRVVRVVLLVARMRRSMSRLSWFAQRSNLLALLGITVGIVFIGAFAALVLDSGVEQAQITNFSDAVWWSLSTVTTVGYGDIVPNSVAARVVGMGLMVVGIGVMAAFISQVSATLVESRMKRSSEQHDFRATIIAEIKERIDNIDELSENDLGLLVQMIQALRLKGGSNG